MEGERRGSQACYVQRRDTFGANAHNSLRSSHLLTLVNYPPLKLPSLHPDRGLHPNSPSTSQGGPNSRYDRYHDLCQAAWGKSSLL